MYDVAALGESLIDFTPEGTNGMGMPLFSQNPGGAPANVLAMNAKLGGRTAFIGKVGADGFGDFLRDTMAAAGIDVGGLRRTAACGTTLAFVHLDPSGDRSFSFYRKPGADILLEPGEVDPALLRSCRVFHFGSVSLTDEPSRSATLHAARTARSAGAVVSYDPNYRAFLWDDEAQAVAQMTAGLDLADIVKVSEEEMTLLTGETDLERGAEALRAHGAALVLVTRGPDGAYFLAEGGRGLVPAYPVHAVDTTGSGDAFLGALLWRLRGLSVAELDRVSQAEWASHVAFANAAGGLTATKKGAIPAMPDLAQIERLVNR